MTAAWNLLSFSCPVIADVTLFRGLTPGGFSFYRLGAFQGVPDDGAVDVEFGGKTDREHRITQWMECPSR